MTSEPDSSPRRRPPTIDLTATEVDTAASAAAPPGETKGFTAAGAGNNGQSRRPPEQAPVRGSASLLSMMVAGAVASAIGILAALWLSSGVPLRQQLSPSVPPPDNAAIADISARLTALEHTIATRQPDQAVLSGIAAADVAAKAQADAVAALGRRVDDLATAAQSALAQANTATSAAAAASGNATDAAKSAAQAAASHDDLDALTGRVAAVEATVKALPNTVAQQKTARGDLNSLTSRVAALEDTLKAVSNQFARQTANADDRPARSAIAAEALRAAVERSAPYQAELATVQALGADPNAIATLTPFAAAGLPSAAALGSELAALMPALQQAAVPAANDGSLLGRLQANAQELVHVTPINAPPGNDAASVTARIGVDAAQDNVAAALADIAKLPPAARSVVAAWVQKAQAREAAITSARGIAAAALAALAKPASQ